MDIEQLSCIRDIYRMWDNHKMQNCQSCGNFQAVYVSYCDRRNHNRPRHTIPFRNYTITYYFLISSIPYIDMVCLNQRRVCTFLWHKNPKALIKSAFFNIVFPQLFAKNCNKSMNNGDKSGKTLQKTILPSHFSGGSTTSFPPLCPLPDYCPGEMLLIMCGRTFSA